MRRRTHAATVRMSEPASAISAGIAGPLELTRPFLLLPMRWP